MVLDISILLPTKADETNTFYLRACVRACVLPLQSFVTSSARDRVEGGAAFVGIVESVVPLITEGASPSPLKNWT